jgi:predicted amidohydrolase
MKICVVSAHPKIGGKKKNLSKVEKYVVQEAADLFVFGELFLTGYVCRDDIRDMAEPLDGESIEKMRELAQANKCSIVCGMPLMEREGLISNAAVLIQPDGYVSAYRKSFLANFGPFEERFFFTPGSSLPVFSTNFGRMGICICYEVFFPEMIKTLALNGADLVVCISASPSVTREFFEKVLPARAIENTVFVAYANLVGNQENLTFWGGGQVYDPTGTLLSRGEYFKEGCIIADIDFQCLEHVRISRPTLRDTRSDVLMMLYQTATHKDEHMLRGYAFLGMKLGEYVFKEISVEKVVVYGKRELTEGIIYATGCKRENISFEKGHPGAKFIGNKDELVLRLTEQVIEAAEMGLEAVLPFLDRDKIFVIES